jgi:hypothetical protein
VEILSDNRISNESGLRPTELAMRCNFSLRWSVSTELRQRGWVWDDTRQI